MPSRKFLDNIEETYSARLTNRQWRIIISALAESSYPESERLANDLIKFVLPPELFQIVKRGRQPEDL